MTEFELRVIYAKHKEPIDRLIKALHLARSANGPSSTPEYESYIKVWFAVERLVGPYKTSNECVIPALIDLLVDRE